MLPGIFYEDFESGTNGWTLTGSPVVSRWELSGKNAKLGSGSLWADDSYHGTTSYAETRKIRLPASGKIYLHFSHQYSFERDSLYYYDGGVVEYALNNDWAFTDASPLLMQVKTTAGRSSKEARVRWRAARPSWETATGTWICASTLSSLAGKVVRFHWMMSTDEADYGIGWFVDEVRIYQCVSIPGVPILSKPANNALLSDYTPTFDWTDSTLDLHHYQLQLATDSAFTINLLTYDDIPASIFTPTVNLSGCTLYFWRVRAFNAAGKSSAWSVVRNFRTAFAGPVNGAPSAITTADLRPKFTWNVVAGASSYHIQVSTSSTFGTLCRPAGNDQQLPFRCQPARRGHSLLARPGGWRFYAPGRGPRCGHSPRRHSCP